MERLQKALLLVTKEREMSKLQAKIQKQVEAKISTAQREYFLHEQLKSIKKELGLEQDDKESLAAKFEKRVASAVGIPEGARKVRRGLLAGVLQPQGSCLATSCRTSRNTRAPFLPNLLCEPAILACR